MAQVTRLSTTATPTRLYGSFAGKTVISWTTLNNIVLYETAEWPSGATWYFEAVMKATTGTVYARLWDKTDSAVVADSQVDTASGTFVRVRGGSPMTLTDSHEYQAEVGKTGANAGGIVGVVAV
jgi:hypothetical protein